MRLESWSGREILASTGFEYLADTLDAKEERCIAAQEVKNYDYMLLVSWVLWSVLTFRDTTNVWQKK